MTATFDALSYQATSGTGTTTWTHTPSGTPTGVVIWVSYGVQPTSPTASYGGAAMNLEIGPISDGQFRYACMFSLPGPAAGPQTVSVTGIGFDNDIRGQAATVTGSVATGTSLFRSGSAVYAATAGGNTPTSSPSLSITSPSGDLLLSSAFFYQQSPSDGVTNTDGFTAAAGNQASNAYWGAQGFFTDYVVGAGSGQASSYSSPTSSTWVLQGGSVQAAAGGGGSAQAAMGRNIMITGG